MALVTGLSIIDCVLYYCCYYYYIIVSHLQSHAAHIDCGDAGLGSNAGLSVVDFCDGVFDVVHASLSSPHVIVDHTEIVCLRSLLFFLKV